MRCFCLFCNDVALALTFSSSWLRRSLLQHARDDLSAACRYPFRYSVFGERKGHEEYLKSLNGQVKVCNDIRRYWVWLWRVMYVLLKSLYFQTPTVETTRSLPTLR